MSEDTLVRDPETLDRLYGTPVPQSLTKEIDHLNEPYRAFVERAPFVLVATSGPGGLDCSPRGDAPGFVRVEHARSVLLPDRRGNNRLDTLRNIVADPRIALLFMVPGVGETLRINGRAEIDTDPALCASFAVDGKAPVTVLRVLVDRVYFQCQKAIARSALWRADTQARRGDLPSAGEMLAATSREAFDGKAYDEAYPERMARTIY